MLLRLVEGEVLELTSSVSDVLPQDVASLVGLQGRELSTRGDGACAFHGAFGSLPDVLSAELHLQHPRLFLRSTSTGRHTLASATYTGKSNTYGR